MGTLGLFVLSGVNDKAGAAADGTLGTALLSCVNEKLGCANGYGLIVGIPSICP